MPLIMLEPDPEIETGHQRLLIDMDAGFYVAAFLMDPVPPEEWSYQDGRVIVPHTHDVDQKIVRLINELAHVRFSAPDLVQLTLTEDSL